MPRSPKGMMIEGLKVRDAKKKVRLIITKNDVKRGSTKNPDSCAAALACLRNVRGCTAAKVHIGRTFLKVGHQWLRFRTPPALRSEIVAFDRGGTFEPGEYALRPLSRSEKAKRGKAHSLGAPKHGRPGHHRQKAHIVTGIRSNAHAEMGK